jgi:hypothetical protein
MSDRPTLILPSGDGGGISKGKIPFPQRDSITAYQVNTLLNIQQSMLAALLQPHREFEKGPQELNGEAQTAALATLIHACARLDDILTDKSRWTFEAQNTLESKLTELYQAHINLADVQKQTAREVTSPHFQNNPAIVRLPDGAWAAVLGDLNELDKAVVGVGSTPRKALEAFDSVFEGRWTEEMKQWVDKANNKNEGTKSNTGMDSGGAEKAKNPRPGRKNPRRNRSRPAPDAGLGEP